MMHAFDRWSACTQCGREIGHIAVFRSPDHRPVCMRRECRRRWAVRCLILKQRHRSNASIADDVHPNGADARDYIAGSFTIDDVYRAISDGWGWTQ